MKNYLKNKLDLTKVIDVLDECPLWSSPFGLKLLNYIEYKLNISVLDIGSGTGFPLTEIALRLGDTCVFYGVEPSKEAIKRINKKIQLYNISNISIINEEAESIPLEKNSINLITSNNGINNVRDIDKVLSECSRIIKKGGQFIQTMNTNLSMFEFYELFEEVLTILKMDFEVSLMYQHISQKRPSINSMISKLKKNGFLIRNIEYDQFNYKFVNGTAMLNHYFIRMAFLNSWISILPPEKVEKTFDFIELKLNEKSQKSGPIKISIPFVVIDSIKQ